MVEAFKQFVIDHSLCKPGDKILVAVSGGIDSVVLVNLFYNSGYDFAVAHCNFKLRGAESDEDERFVKELASLYKVKVFTKFFSTEKFAAANKCSIQEAARELRYDWFNTLSEKEGFSFIATGHHLDDQLETFFINLLRGSGISGLKGMPEKRGKIIRPLLFAKRYQIDEYAKIKKLRFREDSSNTSDKYLRNLVRHQLLPLLLELKPSSQDTLLSSMSFLQEENELLNSLIDQERANLFSKHQNGCKAEIAELKLVSRPLFFKLLSIYDFSRSDTDSIYKSMLTGKPGKTFYSDSHKLLIDRECLIIQKKEIKDSSPEYLVYDGVSNIDEPVKLMLNKLPNDGSFNLVKSSAQAYFDLKQLKFPLKLRKWKHGDRFIPFGMKGKKLLSDFLIDEKVSQFDKENVWVLLSDDIIIWIVGYRAAENCRISATTKTVLKVCVAS